MEVVEGLQSWLKVLDTSGKVFKFPIALTCRGMGCWVRDGWEGSESRGLYNLCLSGCWSVLLTLGLSGQSLAN